MPPPTPLRLAALVALAAASQMPAAQPLPEWPDVPGLIAAIRAPDIPRRDFSVADFGADPSGRSDSLPAIRRAIDAAVAAQGGRVIVPAGHYLVAGPIHLESRIELHLEKDSTLLFSGRPADFLPLVQTRWEGTIVLNYSPLIYARGCHDIAITGSGTLDGNARAEFTSWVPKAAPFQDKLRQMGADGVPLAQRRFGEGAFLRPGFIEPYECTNVLVEGVTLTDSPFWVVHPIFCSDVTVRNVSVDSLTINNDGCDPDSCRNVLIEGCRFHTGDDGIAIKAGRDADAWRDGRNTENIFIRRCTFQSKINAVCVGSEESAGVRNVFIEDSDVTEGTSCLYFKANLDRGGYIEHVRVRNVRVGESRGAVIRFEPNYHSPRGGHSPAKFSDFVFEDVTCREAAAYFLYAEGFPGQPVTNVLLRNVTVTKAKEPLRILNVKGLRCENVTVDGALLPVEPSLTPPRTPRLPIRM